MRISDWSSDVCSSDLITDTAHDVTIDRVAMRNALDTVNDYRNGDGFATERGTYDITLRNVIATGNSDGGLDLKSDNVVIDGAIVSGNGRNIQIGRAHV